MVVESQPDDARRHPNGLGSPRFVAPRETTHHGTPPRHDRPRRRLRQPSGSARTGPRSCQPEHGCADSSAKLRHGKRGELFAVRAVPARPSDEHGARGSAVGGSDARVRYLRTHGHARRPAALPRRWQRDGARAERAADSTAIAGNRRARAAQHARVDRHRRGDMAGGAAAGDDRARPRRVGAPRHPADARAGGRPRSGGRRHPGHPHSFTRPHAFRGARTP